MTGASGATGDSLPIDPDVAVGPTRPIVGQRYRGKAVVVFAVGCGGIVGAVARYLILLAEPTATGHFPWGTFIINVSGSGLLGFLLVMIVEQFPRGHLARPVLGTGILGAYTTFSTLAVEAMQLARHGRVGLAALDVGGSIVAGLAAVWVGMVGARLALRADWRPRR